MPLQGEEKTGKPSKERTADDALRAPKGLELKLHARSRNWKTGIGLQDA